MFGQGHLCDARVCASQDTCTSINRLHQPFFVVPKGYCGNAVVISRGGRALLHNKSLDCIAHVLVRGHQVPFFVLHQLGAVKNAQDAHAAVGLDDVVGLSDDMERPYLADLARVADGAEARVPREKAGNQHGKVEAYMRRQRALLEHRRQDCCHAGPLRPGDAPLGYQSLPPFSHARSRRHEQHPPRAPAPALPLPLSLARALLGTDRQTDSHRDRHGPD